MCVYGIDEGIRDSAQTKAACEKCGVGTHVCDGSRGGREHFVDFMAAGGGRERSKRTILCLKTGKCSIGRIGALEHIPFRGQKIA